MMSLFLRAAVLVVALFGASGLTYAQNAECQSVQFSAEVIDRFPGARSSCLDVIQRDGQQYAVFKAQLLDVRGNTLRIRVKSPDGAYGPTTALVAKPDRKVLIDGKMYPVSELAPNQEITAYVRVDSPQIALAPATETEPVESFPLPEPEQVSGPMKLSSAAAPSMPNTASSIGYLAVLGTFLIITAAILTLMRVYRRRDP
jgi:hypothetical protein